MKLSLPDDTRIGKVTVGLAINNVSPLPDNFSELHFMLERIDASGASTPVIVDTKITTDSGGTPSFATGPVQITCFPVPSCEMIDNAQYQYWVDATFIVHNMSGPAPLVPAGAVVWQNMVFSYS